MPSRSTTFSCLTEQLATQFEAFDVGVAAEDEEDSSRFRLFEKRSPAGCRSEPRRKREQCGNRPFAHFGKPLEMDNPLVVLVEAGGVGDVRGKRRGVATTVFECRLAWGADEMDRFRWRDRVGQVRNRTVPSRER